MNIHDSQQAYGSELSCVIHRGYGGGRDLKYSRERWSPVGQAEGGQVEVIPHACFLELGYININDRPGVDASEQQRELEIKETN